MNTNHTIWVDSLAFCPKQNRYTKYKDSEYYNPALIKKSKMNLILLNNIFNNHFVFNKKKNAAKLLYFDQNRT